MANWQRKIDIKDSWKKAENKEITFQDLAKIIYKKLSKIEKFGIEEIDDELEELIWEFKSVITDQYLDEEYFDDLMKRLYDWGDTLVNYPHLKVEASNYH